jgi:hypothetical protein
MREHCAREGAAMLGAVVVHDLPVAALADRRASDTAADDSRVS